MFIDGKRQSVEPGLPGQMLQRDPLSPLFQKRFVPPCLLFLRLRITVGKVPAPAYLKHFFQQQPRIRRRFLNAFSCQI